uniref:5-hydroxytryptamine receptor 3A n=1 Tax=Erpetoichthys calabaricus TaxID=27687 RepID=A0A8C4RXX9_ERPCA
MFPKVFFSFFFVSSKFPDPSTSSITSLLHFISLFWYNEFLVWDPKDFNGLAKVSIPVDNIWRPDIYVYEFVEEDLSPQIPYLYVRNTGRVTHDKPLRIISSCNLDIFYFPFDIQTCTLSLGSYLHTGTAIWGELDRKRVKVNIQSKGEWELLFIEAHTTTWQSLSCSFPNQVRMKRRPLLYLVNLIVPSAFLMVIDLFSFYLPLHRVDRGAFKMTLLLGYTVFLLIMNDLLPNNAGGTPIIGIYFSVCLALMVISLMETIFVMNILHQTRSNVLEVPPFLRTLTFSIIAKLICSEPADEEKANITKTVDFLLLKNLKSPPLTQMLLKKLSEDIFAIRSHLDSKNKKALMQSEWIVVASLWDCLLFRVYLLFFVLFSVVIIVSWCMWYTA